MVLQHANEVYHFFVVAYEYKLKELNMSWDTVINTMIFLVGSLTIIVAGIFFAFGRDNAHPDDIIDYDPPGIPLMYRFRTWLACRFYDLYDTIHPHKYHLRHDCDCETLKPDAPYLDELLDEDEKPVDYLDELLNGSDKDEIEW